MLILSPDCHFKFSGNKCFISQEGEIWEASRALINTLISFQRPHSIDKYKNINSELYKMLKEFSLNEKLLLEYRGPSCEFKDLQRKRTSEYFDVYADENLFINLINVYLKKVKAVRNLVTNKYTLEPLPFKIILFSNIDNYKRIAGNDIPSWAQCFVWRDNIIQKVDKNNSVLNSDAPLSKWQLRSMTHEFGHILTYSYSRYIPNWLSEGISEYIACELFSEFTYQFKNRKKIENDLNYFFINPSEQLIKHDSNYPLNNRLYQMAGLWVKNLVEKRGLKTLCETLTDYVPDIPVQEYLFAKGWRYS